MHHRGWDKAKSHIDVAFGYQQSSVVNDSDEEFCRTPAPLNV